ELEFLRVAEGLDLLPREAAPAEGEVAVLQRDEVAALPVRLLDRRLRVLEEAGEILADLQVREGEPELVVVGDVALLHLEVGAEREARRVAALLDRRVIEDVVAVVKADLAGVVVVLADDAGRVVVGRVEAGGDTEGAVVAELAFVLRLRGAALGV